MDNFLTKPTVLKLIAVLLTVYLFIQVNAELEGKSLGSTSIFNDKITDTAHDIPVQLRYDKENLVVSGTPSVVDVTLTGPKSLVVSAINKRDFQVEIILNNPKIGNQKVSLTVSNLSKKLDYNLSLTSATINVQEKINKKIKVTADSKYIDFGEGYSVDTLTVEPETVKVTGGKDSINKIVVVKANLRSDGKVTDDLTQEVEVVAYDKSSKKLNVQFEPETVTVRMKVKKPGKVVPITAVISGKPAKGFSIANITLDKQNVAIYGKASALEGVTEIQLPIDVSGLKKTTTITGTLTVPAGIEDVLDRTVKVTIRIAKEASRSITNIRVSPQGLDKDKYSVSYPSGNQVDLTVRGAASVLDALKAKDFTITFAVADFTEGTHTVNLVVSGPENVTWTLSQKTIEIELVKK